MYCAIDFGTSNSAVSVPVMSAMKLVALEADHSTMPTAVFYFEEGGDAAGGPLRAFGRAAQSAYVEGVEGRLMRSMKSILGSSLVHQTAEVGGGRGVKYLDIISNYLQHLKALAEKQAGGPLRQVMLGRPVFFVDDDPVRDAQAQSALEAAARAVGFEEVCFQYEPLAAAFDFESRVSHGERLVLVVDVGGGTSDFSVVRVGPKRARELDRKADILAHHGVHVAGTNFDGRIELAAILCELGYGSMGPSIRGAPPKEVPSKLYFDLATWHLINTAYAPKRVAELRGMRGFYGNPVHHERLMKVLTEHLGHELAARAEKAKIDGAQGGEALIDLSVLERAWTVKFSSSQAQQSLQSDISSIVNAAREAAVRAGLGAADVEALYFTGGSTGLNLLTHQIAAAFPDAQCVTGDRLASVATGLGLHAQRCFGSARFSCV